MFLKRKKSQRFGASSFSKFYYTLQKNPFATPRMVLQWPSLLKNPWVIGRNSARCSYHTYLFDSCLPWLSLVSIEYLTICWYAPEFQNFPELIKIEKVAETFEFDGKEPLFVETAMGISKRVLGWSPYRAGSIRKNQGKTCFFEKKDTVWENP